MKKLVIAYFLALIFGIAHAVEVGYMQDNSEDGGAKIVFFDEQWQCPEGAFKFEVFNRDGRKIINGCYKHWEDKVLMISEFGGKYMLPQDKITWGKK